MKLAWDEANTPEAFRGGRFVPGEGPLSANIMLVGEAPGQVEDKQGRPFIGPSGRRLMSALKYGANLNREDVYLTNIVKHQPPKNRDPKVSEAKPYLPLLKQEIDWVDPDFIIALGRIPLRYLDKRAKLKTDHGCPRWCKVFDWEGWVIPWYHPAHTFRSAESFAHLARDARRLLGQVDGLPDEPVPTNYKLATESEVIRELDKSRADIVGFDTETTGPTRATGSGGRPVFMTDEAEMLGWSISWEDGQGYYVEARDFGPGMRSVLGFSEIIKVSHNAKFEYKILKKLGVEFANFHDTKLAAYLIGETATGLKPLTRQWLGIDPIRLEDVLKGRKTEEVAAEEWVDYATADADHALRLWKVLEQEMQVYDLEKVYYGIELPLIPILAKAEARGVLVDEEQCLATIDVLKRAQGDARIEAEKRLRAGPDFNLDSPRQLETRLLELGAPLKKKTKSGESYSTDKDVLEELEKTPWEPETVAAINKYRKFGKLMSYPQSFLALRSYDNRLHSSLNQSGHFEETGGEGSAPATGRLSSSGPNMTNVPHHHAQIDGYDWAPEIRDCIIAPEGYVLMPADLAQEEPRIIASIARDETLLKGFAEGRDIYRPATEALYPRSRDGQDDKTWKAAWNLWERFIGKTFVLAYYYGAEDDRLKDLDHDLDKETIAQAMRDMAEAHPARPIYLVQTMAELEEHGYVESIYGRKRWLPGAYSHSRIWREEALRAGANMKVQGTAADILKMALARIDAALEGMNVPMYTNRLTIAPTLATT